MFFFLKDVVRTCCIFSFLFFLDKLFILCDSKPCTHFVIYIEFVITFFHLLLHVLFCFSLYEHASYFLFAIFYFCFTLKCHDEFCLKCFRNTGCQSLSYYKLSSCKVFQEFVLGLNFIVFNKWVLVEWFMTSLICSFVCCGFVTDCQRERLLRYIWIMLGTYVI